MQYRREFRAACTIALATVTLNSIYKCANYVFSKALVSNSKLYIHTCIGAGAYCTSVLRRQRSCPLRKTLNPSQMQMLQTGRFLGCQSLAI